MARESGTRVVTLFRIEFLIKILARPRRKILGVSASKHVPPVTAKKTKPRRTSYKRRLRALSLPLLFTSLSSSTRPPSFSILPQKSLQLAEDLAKMSLAIPRQPVELSPGEVREIAPAPSDEEWRANYNIHIMCPECREVPPNLVEEFAQGDLICGTCGMVLQSRIVDTRSEWRTFSNDEGNDDPSRVGDASDPLLEGEQLFTSIGHTANSTVSRDLNRTQQKATMSKENRARQSAYSTIDTLCASMDFSKQVSTTAQQLYEKTLHTKQFKGKSQDAIIASCIFIACRQNKTGRTFKEITALTRVPKKDIGRTFKALEKFFQRHSQQRPTTVSGGTIVAQAEYSTTPSTKAQELCSRYASQLALAPRIGLISGECASEMVERGSLAGRSPLTIAAVSIYMISYLMGDGKNPKEISAVADVSDGTIRSAYKLVFNEKDKLVKQEWLDQGGKVENLPHP